MERVEQIDVTFFIHDGDLVFTDRDELGVRHIELATVRGANDERLKTADELLANLFDVHATIVRSNLEESTH